MLALASDVSAAALVVVKTGVGVLALRLDDDGVAVAVIPDGDTAKVFLLWNVATEVRSSDNGEVGVTEEDGASLSWASSVPTLSLFTDRSLFLRSRTPEVSRQNWMR